MKLIVSKDDCWGRTVKMPLEIVEDNITVSGQRIVVRLKERWCC